MSDGRFIGIDVGGTKVATAVLENGTLRDVRPGADAHGLERAARRRSSLEEIERCAARARVAVAVGLPSIIDAATGRVRHTVNLPLRDVPLRALLTERCGLPVYVENDASCAALAEAQVAGQIVCENLVMFTIGTGVGGGLVLGGKLYRGATSAVELGHTLIGARPAPTARRPTRARSRSPARSRRSRPAARSTGSRSSRPARTRSRSSAGGSPRATRSPATTRSRARARATCTAST